MQKRERDAEKEKGGAKKKARGAGSDGDFTALNGRRVRTVHVVCAALPTRPLSLVVLCNQHRRLSRPKCPMAKVWGCDGQQLAKKLSWQTRVDTETTTEM